MPPSSKKRRRGGQSGNDNAFRHGFYARHFSPTDNLDLDRHVKGEFIDEINASRVCMSNLFAVLKDTQGLSPQDIVSINRAIGNFIGHNISLIRTRHAIYQKQTTMEQILEELKHIPPEQDQP